MIDVEGGNNMLYLPLDKLMEQSASSVGRTGSTAELRDLAEQIAPYLPAPSAGGTVDRSRLNSTSRGTRQ